MTILLVLNTLAAVVSAASAVLAVTRPELLTKSTAATAGERLYALAYAARAIPFGLITAVLSWTDSGTPVAVLLLAAAATQLADAGIGIWRGEKGMIAGGSTLAAIHLITAISLW